MTARVEFKIYANPFRRRRRQPMFGNYLMDLGNTAQLSRCPLWCSTWPDDDFYHARSISTTCASGPIFGLIFSG
jgi:hypothetical protein